MIRREISLARSFTHSLSTHSLARSLTHSHSSHTLKSQIDMVVADDLVPAWRQAIFNIPDAPT